MRRKDFLQPYSYDTFYQLAHNYSENLLGYACVPGMCASLLKRLIASHSTSQDDPQLKTAVEMLEEHSHKLNVAVRAAFWPVSTANLNGELEFSEAQAQDEAVNRQRWAPYD